MPPGKKPLACERFFKVLGDRTRLRLLNLMNGQEICVCFLVEILGLPQPKISRHLACLRQAGLVTVRREGKWMHYCIAGPSDDGTARLFKEILAWLQEEKSMQADRARLARACCGSKHGAVPGDAPLPVCARPWRPQDGADMRRPDKRRAGAESRRRKR